MRLHPSSWKVSAATKRADTLNKIPPQWRLGPADLAAAQKQRDLTGPFIQQFLNADEVSIISRDSVAIVEDIKKGRLTAVQVTTAFCKTAAIAHQIVSYPGFGLSCYIPLNWLNRCTDKWNITHIEQLPPWNIFSTSSRARRLAWCSILQPGGNYWPAPWPPYQLEGPIPH